MTDAGVGRSRSRAGLSSSRSSGPRCALQSCAVLTAATFLSACGGSSQSPQQDVPPAEAGAIAAAQACFQQEGYRVRLDANGMGMAVSGDGNESAHIEVLTSAGGPYLSATLDGDAASVLHPSALRDAVHECLAPYKAPPPPSLGDPL